MQKIGQDEAIAIVRRLKKTLESEGVPVQKAFLFGSFAKNHVHEWSDIDVAIVHNPFLSTVGKEKSLLFTRGKSFDVRIELLSFRPIDFANRYSSIAQEVKNQGMSID